ncbi:hypothetical protein K438DRAFT_2059511 [Mycena galopus ATCC 62051]|nr:hypothetical protein K438DRAFT_2059511 [Mycena galopus ATCC 62051]
MLAVAIEYKAVFNDMTANRDLDYRKFDISNAEWTLVEDMLHVLKDATLYFSSEKHCTITQVIPTMDKIDDIITSTVVSSAPAAGAPNKRIIHSSIKSALKLAKKVMNKYYSATDESKVYRVAMGTSRPRYNTVSNTTHTVLHPNIKLEYFRSRRWEREWIDTAKSLVRVEYDSNYAHLPAAAGGMETGRTRYASFSIP